MTSTTSVVQITLSANDAARALGISPRTLWTKTKSGAIPHLKIGKRTLYPAALLEQWVMDQVVKVTSEAA